MVSDDVLKILRCPQDRSKLRVADNELVSRINAAITAGQVQNKAGCRVDRTIDGGLVRSAGDVLYPIVDHIPVLLADESILLEQIQPATVRGSS